MKCLRKNVSLVQYMTGNVSSISDEILENIRIKKEKNIDKTAENNRGLHGLQTFLGLLERTSKLAAHCLSKELSILKSRFILLF